VEDLQQNESGQHGITNEENVSRHTTKWCVRDDEKQGCQRHDKRPKRSPWWDQTETRNLLQNDQESGPQPHGEVSFGSRDLLEVFLKATAVAWRCQGGQTTANE
jgi:hypothetical protein